MKAALPLAILLAACGKQATQPAKNAEAPSPAAKPVAPAAKPFVYEEKNYLIEFHFAWSAEAAAVPQLVSRFRKEMGEAKAELIAGARKDKAIREQAGDEFNGFMWSTDYRTAGQSDRLLSLSAKMAPTLAARMAITAMGVCFGTASRHSGFGPPTFLLRRPIWTGCSPSAGATR